MGLIKYGNKNCQFILQYTVWQPHADSRFNKLHFTRSVATVLKWGDQN